jgi:hypothetical protein
MKKIIALLLVLFTCFTYSQNTKETYHRAKIFYNNSDDLRQLESVGIAMDHGFHKKNSSFESDFSESEIQKAQELGFTTEITIQDVRSFYLNRNNPSHKDYVASPQTRNATCSGNGTVDYQTPANFNVFPSNQYGGFYTYSQVLQELDDMVNLFPNLITVKSDIGPSGNPFLTEGQADNSTTPSIGGNGIKWVKISDNPNTNESEPQVLYTSIHHAREPASLSQLIFYMWYLLENYATDSEIQSIVDNTELYFVPVVNPDGYLYNGKTDPQGGGFWRKNRKNGNGTDNNRNYDYHINGDASNGSWSGPGSSGNPGSEVYHGTAPFSEAENQAMKWFVEQHSFVLALNNHTFGQLLYYPFAYADVATPDDALFQGITTEMVSQNGYTNLRDNPFAGDSDDFMYGTVGTHSKIFSMTPEVGTSFWPAQSTIESICKEMMYLNLTAANLVNNYATISEISPAFVETTTSNIDYTFKRLGLPEPANFTININPVSANIQSVGAANTHNNVPFLQEITDNITLNLNASIAVGDQIVYELIINNGSFDKVLTITKIFGQPTIVLDEFGNNTSTNWNATSWSSTTEDFVSASSSITDSPNSNYGNNINNIITLSNQIDLSGLVAATLSFQAKWEIENNFDYVQLEISTNNGGSWIPQCGNFTNDGVTNQGSANNEPLYDGTQNDWILENIDLSDYLDQNILIRFKLVTDNNTTGDGFYFDDLQVKTLQDNLSVNDFIKHNFNVYPNPVQDILNINTNIQGYKITVHNIQGQLIFSRSNNTGNSFIDYSNFAKGFYLLNINSQDSNQAFKIIKQ